MARIVLLGATGFTGRLIAKRLARGEAETVLAGRSRNSLIELAERLGGASETAEISLDDPKTIARLLGPGDVLVTTVGAFVRRGDVALSAAIESGAHYLDITGEAPFIREVFERPDAAAAEGALVPAMGFNYAPGNLAGAIALERLDGAVHRLDIGYFFTGDAQAELSGGTLDSVAGVLMSPSFTWRNGVLRTERCGARTRSFDVAGRNVPAMTLGSSEAITLSRSYPSIEVIDVYQGGLGPATPFVAQVSRVAPIPGVSFALNRLNDVVVRLAPDGPDASTRARAGTHVVAIASDRAGHVVDEVVLRGPNVYDLTADLVAWGARRAAEGEISGTGALGPIDAFGLDGLEEAHNAAGMFEQHSTVRA